MLQRLTALYLILFISLTLSARHEHRNALADLVGDAASDSGKILESPAHLAGSPGLASAALVEDASCLACFFSDVVAPDASASTLGISFEQVFLPVPRSATRLVFADLPASADRGPPLA